MQTDKYIPNRQTDIINANRQTDKYIFQTDKQTNIYFKQAKLYKHANRQICSKQTNRQINPNRHIFLTDKPTNIYSKLTNREIYIPN